jgi:hypothetical protein
MDGLGYNPRAFSPFAFTDGGEVYNPGTPGPRTNMEAQGRCPRVWPTIYCVMQRGLGAMPTFILGPTPFVFNNQISGGAPGYNVSLPGMGKTPFGG